MKTSTRRWIGVALISAPFVAHWLLVAFRVFPETLVSSETSSSGSNIVTTSVYIVHYPPWWPLAFLGAILLGLGLLFLPGRKHPIA